MDPHGPTTPGLHLPQPSPIQAHQNPAQQQYPASPAVSPHGAVDGQVMPPLQQPLPTPAPQPQQTQPVAVGSAVPSSAVSEDIADDQQDEEWINKAKEIVERNRMDPYSQSRELGQLKAQYLKARYNKDIKTSKDQT